MTVPQDAMKQLMESLTTTGAIIKTPCQASIWLLGGAANCNKEAGHEGRHEVRIEWAVS